jgi:hypothetical protein
MMSTGSTAAPIAGIEIDGIAGEVGGGIVIGGIAAGGGERSGSEMIGVLGAVIFGTVTAGPATVDEGGGSVVLGDDGGVAVTVVAAPVVVEAAELDDGAALDDSGATDRRSTVSSVVELGTALVSTAAIGDSVRGGGSSCAPAAPSLSSAPVAASPPARTSARPDGNGISGMGSVGGVTIVPSTSGRGLAISIEVSGLGFPIVAIAATAAMTPAPTRKPRGVCTGEASKHVAGTLTSPAPPRFPSQARARPVIHAPARTTAVPATANGAM